MRAYSVISAVIEGPAPEDVKAGWVALIIFLLGAVAVAALGFSLVKHLRRAQASKDLGLYGDEPVDTSERTDPPAPDGPTRSS